MLCDNKLHLVNNSLKIYSVRLNMKFILSTKNMCMEICAQNYGCHLSANPQRYF